MSKRGKTEKRNSLRKTKIWTNESWVKTHWSGRIALEEEKKKFEYERWYASLTPTEQEKEDTRKKVVEERERRLAEERAQREKQEAEERRIREEQQKQKSLLEAKTKKKKKIVLISLISSILLLIVGVVVGIKIKLTIIEHNSDTYKLLKYLGNSDIGYNDGVLSQYMDIEGRGRVYFNLEYVKGGWIASPSNIYDFRVTDVVPPKEDSLYTNLQTSMCFNLSGTDNKTLLNTYSAKFTYSTDYAVIDYKGVSYSSSSDNIIYTKAFLSDSRWDETALTLLLEYQETGWGFMSAGYLWFNALFQQATGKKFYV